MEYKISELMELISDDSISLSDYDEVSPRRIKEMVNGKIQGSGRKPPKSRNLGRTLLIAAIISAFFAVSAFAIGYSINRQRQQELREQLQIDENHVGGYQEYYLPEEHQTAKYAPHFYHPSAAQNWTMFTSMSTPVKRVCLTPVAPL